MGVALGKAQSDMVIPASYNSVNIYGWKRIGTGKNRGGYFHPSFVQGIPELCMLLKRAPVPDGKQNDDDEKSCAPAPIRLVESMPSERNHLNEGSNMALFGMDQMFPLKNPLFGNLNTIPKEAFQLQKEVNCQPASTSTYKDPFGVGGTDSFCHTNYTDRNTAPRALIGGSGKMSEDMHLFADIFSQRDFIDEFRPDARSMGIMMPREMFDDGFPQKNQGDSSNQGPGACENVFPQKLHFLLNQAEKEGFDHIISWVNDGAAFKVHDSKAFLERVMPNYFDQSKFESFRRQLNLYGFQRVSRGPSRGIYYHQFFLQSEPSLCQSITRPAGVPTAALATTRC